MPTLAEHIIHVTLAVMGWAFFVVVGLPDYYQSWSLTTIIANVILLTIAFFPVTALQLRYGFTDQKHWSNSLWLALYWTLPLFLLDYWWIVVLGGDDMTFIFRYWYLSVFYVSFWIQMPLVALFMRKPDSIRDRSF